MISATEKEQSLIWRGNGSFWISWVCSAVSWKPVKLLQSQGKRDLLNSQIYT